MTNGMKHLTLGLLMAFSAVGCSFGSGSNDQNKEYQEQRDALLRDFENAVGTYSGDIQAYRLSADNSNEVLDVISIPLELGVYIEYIVDGKDADGKMKLIPVLKMRYRQQDTVRSDVILDARYSSHSGSLDAASPSGNTTIRGVLSGNAITGEVVRNGGTLGQFKVQIKNKKVLAPYSDQDLYERAVTEYKKISGLYVGTVTSALNPSYPVQIQLSFTPIAMEDGSLAARLKASYKRVDFADPSMTERLLTVSYRLDTDPAELVMSMDGGTPQIPNAYFMSLNGVLKDETYTADFYDRRGFVGILTVKKQNK